MSAPRPGALPSIFSLEPGTERHERRGRLRVRSDMASTLPVRSASESGRHRTRPDRTCPPTRSTSSPTASSSGCSPAARPGVGERRGRRRRRRPDRRRHAHGALAVGAVRRRRRRARPARCAARVLTHAHIDHVGGTKAFPHAAVYGYADDERAPRPADADRRLQGVHAGVRGGVRRPRRARHPPGHPRGRRRRVADPARRAAPGERAHRRRPASCSSPTSTSASPATCASSASRRSRSRAIPPRGPTCST